LGSHYYVVGYIMRSAGNGAITVYLANAGEPPTIFAGFALSYSIELLLRKQIEKADLFIQSETILTRRIQVPIDLLEYNKRNAEAP
jgi:hypothetical protein